MPYCSVISLLPIIFVRSIICKCILVPCTLSQICCCFVSKGTFTPVGHAECKDCVKETVTSLTTQFLLC